VYTRGIINISWKNKKIVYQPFLRFLCPYIYDYFMYPKYIQNRPQKTKTRTQKRKTNFSIDCPLVLYKIITWQLLIRARNLVFLPTPTWIQVHLAQVHVPASHNIKCSSLLTLQKSSLWPTCFSNMYYLNKIIIIIIF